MIKLIVTDVDGTLVPEDFFYAGAGLTVHGYTANRIAIVPAWQEYVIPTNPDFMESLNFNPNGKVVLLLVLCLE